MISVVALAWKFPVWRTARSTRLSCERHDEDVAARRLGAIDRVHRRHAVRHAGVVDERGVERLGEGEAPEHRAVLRVHRRRSARDVSARDEEDEDPVDAVAMHALGRRLTRLVGARLDAELMSLDSPRVAGRRAEIPRRKVEHAAEDRAVGDRGAIGSNQRTIPPCSAL